MTSLPAILSIILLVSSLILGIFVIIQDPKHKLNQLYTLLVFGISLWILSNLLVDNASSNTSALFWSRATLLGPIIIAPVFLHFSKLFAQRDEVLSQKSYILLYFPILLFLPFIFTKYNIVQVDTSIKPPSVESGFLYYPFLAYFATFVSISFITLINKYRKQKGVYKIQIKWFLVGSLVSVIWGVLLNSILLMFGISEASSYGTLGTFFILLAGWYTITRYRFLGIRVFIGRTFYILAISIIPFVTFYLVYFIQTYFWGSVFATGSIITGIFIAVGFVYLLLFTNTQLNRIINEKIINPGYDPVAQKDKLVKTLASELAIDRVVTHILSTFHTTIKPQGSGIIVFELSDRKVLFRRIRDLDMKNGIRDLLEVIYFWDEMNESKPIIAEELKYTIDNHPIKLHDRLKRILKFMNQRKIAAIFPLNRKVQLNGILLLGPKSDDSAYTVQDVEFIESIVANSSVAIGRSLLHRQVENFAESLREKVKEATKQLEKNAKQLKRKNYALENASKRERDMMDIIGHELRTPASIVKNALGYIEMLDRLEKLEKAKLSKYINKAQESVEREIKLINTFLGATKIENAQMQFDPTKFSIVELAKRVVKENKERASSRKLKLVYKPTEKEIPLIDGDRTRIGEAIDNLISNAIKYTRKGKITVWCDTDKSKKHVYVYVKDTGIGISPKDKKKLFKKFGRLKNYTTEKERMAQIVRPGGTGLGLYLVKGVIELHGGKVFVKSKLGKGSTFYFKLPVKHKIAKKNLMNPIFAKKGEKNLFKKLGLEEEPSDKKNKGNGKKNSTKEK